MNFWKKNDKAEMKSDEYEQLTKKIVGIGAEVESLRIKLTIQETEIAEIRNKVLKRLRLIDHSQDNSGGEEAKNPKTLNSLNPFGI